MMKKKIGRILIFIQNNKRKLVHGRSICILVFNSKGKLYKKTWIFFDFLQIKRKAAERKKTENLSICRLKWEIYGL